MGTIDDIVQEKIDSLKKEVKNAKDARKYDLLWEYFQKEISEKHPKKVFICEDEEEVFLTQSDFENASEYARSGEIEEGEIGCWLGTKIILRKRFE